MHIVKSLKSHGKAACILPHGVLFRGNAEAEIRRKLVDYGFIKAIIGLPANLFYGTGIPACIIVIDKENANARKGILMIDASQGFIKDGAKNRLRERDIHRIVDAFKNPSNEDESYARVVGLDEIIKNAYNLNLPRYIDNSEAEDIQDIEGHLQGGIPNTDIEALADYWKVCPNLKAHLFKPLRTNYSALSCPTQDVKQFINKDAEFVAFKQKMQTHFDGWAQTARDTLTSLKANNFVPKQLISYLSETLLTHYKNQPLVDQYSIYQILMDYWAGIMQDDAYIIAADDWTADVERIIETDKKGKSKDKGWKSNLIPKQLVVNRYFADQYNELVREENKLETLIQEMTELEENNSGDEGILEQGIKEKDVKELWQAEVLEAAPKVYPADFSIYTTAKQSQEQLTEQIENMAKQYVIIQQLLKLPKAVNSRKIQLFAADKNASEKVILNDYESLLKKLNVAEKTLKVKYELFDSGIRHLFAHDVTPDQFENYDVLNVLYQWLELNEKIKKAKDTAKALDIKLDTDTYNYYGNLTQTEIKELVTDDKWLADLGKAIAADVERVAQRLTVRVKELAERYEFTLGELNESVNSFEKLVAAHLNAMGFEL